MLQGVFKHSGRWCVRAQAEQASIRRQRRSPSSSCFEAGRVDACDFGLVLELLNLEVHQHSHDHAEQLCTCEEACKTAQGQGTGRLQWDKWDKLKNSKEYKDLVDKCNATLKQSSEPKMKGLGKGKPGGKY